MSAMTATPFTLVLEDLTGLAALPLPPGETSPPEADLEAFLEAITRPVSAESPCGPHLLLKGTHQAIREARRADDPLPSQGIWQTDLKVSDWGLSRDLSRTALLEKSRDLLLAVWLTEAWGHLHGFGGLAVGMHCCLRLQQVFGNTLHPCSAEADGDDPRQAVLEWAGRTFGLMAQGLPLLPFSGPGGAVGSICLIDWDMAHTQQGSGSNRLSADQADAMLSGVPDGVLILRHSSVRAALAAVKAWAQEIPTLMPGHEVSFGGLKATLERIAGIFGRELRQRGLPDPDRDPDQTPDLPLSGTGDAESAGTVSAEQQDGDAEMGKTSQTPDSFGPLTLTSREDAYRALLKIADFLHQQEPHSPVPYLLRRAHRWGQMPLSELLQEFGGRGIGMADLSILLDIHDP